MSAGVSSREGTVQLELARHQPASRAMMRTLKASKCLPMCARSFSLHTQGMAQQGWPLLCASGRQQHRL